MKLIIPEIDLRSDSGSRSIVDEETGHKVGQIIVAKNSGRSIYLFDNKYQGTFKTHDECVAFVKGVAAVLTHMVSGGALHH